MCSCVVSVKEKIKQRKEIGRKKKLLENVEFDRLCGNGWLEEGFKRSAPRKAVAECA